MIANGEDRRDGRTVVVTGVLGGIGAAVACHFHDDGWRVLGLDRAGSNAPGCDRFLQFDLGRWRDLPDALAELVGDDPVDALVNNAALQYVSPIGEFKDDELLELFSVNVLAAFSAVRTLTPALRRRRGAVVNISSVHARATSGGMSMYAASKAALSGLTRAAALDLASEGVRVNAVLPGAVDTPMLRRGVMGRNGDYVAGMTKLLEGTPLRSVATPQEIARLVGYLADSNVSGFVTGQEFVADGGVLARLGSE